MLIRKPKLCKTIIYIGKGLGMVLGSVSAFFLFCCWVFWLTKGSSPWRFTTLILPLLIVSYFIGKGMSNDY